MASAGSAADSAARPSHVAPVALADVAALLGVEAAGVGDAVVTGLTASSALVRPGDLYAGVAGSRTHGSLFAADARAAGAVAVLTDSDGAAQSASSGLPTLVVDAPRHVLGAVAALVYGRPAEALTLIGVTGTHGKTTVTHLIAAAAAADARRAAVIGTNGTWIAGEPVGSELTTPEAPELHALFAVMRERGAELCAMEVSSHALVMRRVDGVVFDLAVFTNLGRDHLDFHADMEDYFSAKAQLFTAERTRQALVCIDDEHGLRLAIGAQVPTTTYSAHDAVADWVGEPDVDASSPRRSAFTIEGPAGVRLRGSIPMAGRFNVANAVAAIAACAEVGIPPEMAAAGIAEAGAVSGRMEEVAEGQPFSVVVDYAHKPDALAAALDALRPVTAGRLVVVFGAGGDRDRGKRRLMGDVAAQRADVVVVTDDNPRSEDPAAIRAEIIAGATPESSAEILEIGERGEAIAYALGHAAAGDTVLIAGKGHETGQEVGDQVLPFDDRAVAAAAVRDLHPRGGER